MKEAIFQQCCAVLRSEIHQRADKTQGPFGKALSTHLQKYQIQIKGNLRILCFDCWKGNMIHRGTQVVNVLCTSPLWSTKPQSLSSSETTKSVDYIVPYRIAFKLKWANIPDILSKLANSLGFWSLVIALLCRIRLQCFNSTRGSKLISKTIQKMAGALVHWSKSKQVQ